MLLAVWRDGLCAGYACCRKVRVLPHEIGHHLGMDEGELEHSGY